MCAQDTDKIKFLKAFCDSVYSYSTFTSMMEGVSARAYVEHVPVYTVAVPMENFHTKSPEFRVQLQISL